MVELNILQPGLFHSEACKFTCEPNPVPTKTTPNTPFMLDAGAGPFRVQTISFSNSINRRGTSVVGKIRSLADSVLCFAHVEIEPYRGHLSPLYLYPQLLAVYSGAGSQRIGITGKQATGKITGGVPCLGFRDLDTSIEKSLHWMCHPGCTFPLTVAPSAVVYDIFLGNPLGINPLGRVCPSSMYVFVF